MICESRLSTCSACRVAISGLDSPPLLRQRGSCPLKHQTESVLDSIFWLCRKSHKALELVSDFHVKNVGSVSVTHCFLRISTRATLVRSLPVTAFLKASRNSDAIRFIGLEPRGFAALATDMFGPSSEEGLVEVDLFESFG